MFPFDDVIMLTALAAVATTPTAATHSAKSGWSKLKGHLRERLPHLFILFSVCNIARFYQNSLYRFIILSFAKEVFCMGVGMIVLYFFGAFDMYGSPKSV